MIHGGYISQDSCFHISNISKEMLVLQLPDDQLQSDLAQRIVVRKIVQLGFAAAFRIESPYIFVFKTKDCERKILSKELQSQHKAFFELENSFKLYGIQSLTQQKFTGLIESCEWDVFEAQFFKTKLSEYIRRAGWFQYDQNDLTRFFSVMNTPKDEDIMNEPIAWGQCRNVQSCALFINFWKDNDISRVNINIGNLGIFNIACIPCLNKKSKDELKSFERRYRSNHHPLKFLLCDEPIFIKHFMTREEAKETLDTALRFDKRVMEKSKQRTLRNKEKPVGKRKDDTEEPGEWRLDIVTPSSIEALESYWKCLTGFHMNKNEIWAEIEDSDVGFSSHLFVPLRFLSFGCNELPKTGNVSAPLAKKYSTILETFKNIVTAALRDGNMLCFQSPWVAECENSLGIKAFVPSFHRMNENDPIVKRSQNDVEKSVTNEIRLSQRIDNAQQDSKKSAQIKTNNIMKHKEGGFPKILPDSTSTNQIESTIPDSSNTLPPLKRVKKIEPTSNKLNIYVDTTNVKHMTKEKNNDCRKNSVLKPRSNGANDASIRKRAPRKSKRR